MLLEVQELQRLLRKEILCRLLSPGPGIAWDQRADAAIGDQLEHFDHFC